jgi:hypothetical protein
MNGKQPQPDTTIRRIPACGRRPANAKSEARSPKQIQNANTPNGGRRVWTERETNPICAAARAAIRGARNSRYEIRFTRYASAVWTVRQTNPITPYVVAPILRGTTYRRRAVATELMADQGSDDLGQGDDDRRRPAASGWEVVPEKADRSLTRPEPARIDSNGPI